MSERAWTVEEANEALPWVTGLVEQARRLQAGARRHADEAPARAGGNGHGLDLGAARGIADVLSELRAQGVVLRDAQQGLVDFPAVSPSGRPYLLCWLVGEPEVTWWHWPEAGFAGRTPLSEPPG